MTNVDDTTPTGSPGYIHSQEIREVLRVLSSHASDDTTSPAVTKALTASSGARDLSERDRAFLATATLLGLAITAHDLESSRLALGTARVELARATGGEDV